MITFLEYRGPMHFSYHKDNITMPNGAPGFVYTTEFRRKFLEKNFHFTRIDSIYQQQRTAPASSRSIPKQSVHQRGNSWQVPNSYRKSRTAKLPPPYRDFPTFEYGGDPFESKR
jgi:hypothetical protein